VPTMAAGGATVLVGRPLPVLPSPFSPSSCFLFRARLYGFLEALANGRCGGRCEHWSAASEVRRRRAERAIIFYRLSALI